MRITIPTYFTLFRLILIPLMVLFYFILPPKQAHFYAALMFLIASITDWIDGFLARRLKQVSNFGKFLDPVADKLIVTVSLLILIYEYSVNPFDHQSEIVGASEAYLEMMSKLITIASITIVCREMIVTSLREWMANLNLSAVVAVSFWGKVKTAVQMTAIVYLIWRPNRYSPIYEGWNFIEYTAIGLFFASVVLTILSMLTYLKAGYKAATAYEKAELAKEQHAKEQHAKEQQSK